MGNTMLTSRPPLLEKLLMLMVPGKPDTMLKRDFHSIPQERHGPPTCQTMLSRTQISMLKPQPQMRKFLVMPPGLSKLLRTKLTHQRRRRPPPLKPQLPKPPHHSFNSTEAEILPKRELPLNLNQSHQDLNHPAPPAAHHPLTPIELKIAEEKIIVF